jgi:hypothetical protein
MGAAKNSEICAKMIVHKIYVPYSAEPLRLVSSLLLVPLEVLVPVGYVAASAAGLLEGTKAQEVIDKFFFSKHEFPCLELICETGLFDL